MGNPQSLNRYGYALNSPLVFTDSEGLETVPDATQGWLLALLKRLAHWLEQRRRRWV